MIKLLLEPVNLLILDEPTNHLDMKTKDILKDAIRDFDGTVIVVSHDRDFLDGLVQKVYEFGGGRVRENLGGIYDFLRSKNISNLRDIELSKSQGICKAENADSSDGPGIQEAPKKGKISYAEQREREKMLRRLRKRVETAEAEVGNSESGLAEIEALIAAGDAQEETLSKYAEMQKRLENAMSVWELATMELEEVEKESV